MEVQIFSLRLMETLEKITRATVEVAQELGVGYKRWTKITIRPELEGDKGCPSWAGTDEVSGEITLFANTEFRCVAHELGHGIHEWLRHTYGLPNEDGEAFAEAIRWFVEQKLGPSNWKPRADLSYLLQQCDYDFEGFKAYIAGLIKKRH